MRLKFICVFIWPALQMAWLEVISAVSKVPLALLSKPLSTNTPPLMQAALPAATARALPAGTMATLGNPQALMNPELLARLSASPWIP